MIHLYAMDMLERLTLRAAHIPQQGAGCTCAYRHVVQPKRLQAFHLKVGFQYMQCPVCLEMPVGNWADCSMKRSRLSPALGAPKLCGIDAMQPGFQHIRSALGDSEFSVGNVHPGQRTSFVPPFSLGPDGCD